jgi:hypothetical protein
MLPKSKKTLEGLLLKLSVRCNLNFLISIDLANQMILKTQCALRCWVLILCSIQIVNLGSLK